MKRLMLIGVFTIMAGCAVQQQIWEKPGGTQSGFDRDLAQCEHEARLYVRQARPGYRTEIGQALDKMDQRNELVNSCMKARGYRLQAAK